MLLKMVIFLLCCVVVFTAMYHIIKPEKKEDSIPTTESDEDLLKETESIKNSKETAVKKVSKKQELINKAKENLN